MALLGGALPVMSKQDERAGISTLGGVPIACISLFSEATISRKYVRLFSSSFKSLASCLSAVWATVCKLAFAVALSLNRLCASRRIGFL